MTIETYSPAATALTAWAQSASAAHSIAESLVRTSFVPAAFSGKAHEATAAILSGAEVGLSPMASLRAFDIIQGQAAPRALTLRAILQAQGHEVWVEESTATRCIARGRRAGSDKVHESIWTIDRAEKLGLTGKENWRKMPQNMLLARATSECARLTAADAILGVAYSVEELEDGIESGPSSIEASTAKRRTARRSSPLTVAPQVAGEIESAHIPQPDLPPLPGELDEPIQAPPPEPPGNQEDEVDADPLLAAGSNPPNEAEPKTVTGPQLKKIHAMFNEIGVTGRDERLTYVAHWLTREVGSSNELTSREASTVIDALQAEIDDDRNEAAR